jgi:hypothetical protein
MLAERSTRPSRNVGISPIRAGPATAYRRSMSLHTIAVGAAALAAALVTAVGRRRERHDQCTHRGAVVSSNRAVSKYRRTRRCLVLAAALTSAGCGGGDESDLDLDGQAAAQTIAEPAPPGEQPTATSAPSVAATQAPGTLASDDHGVPPSSVDANIAGASDPNGSAPEFGCPPGAAASEAVGVEVFLAEDEVMHGPDGDDGEFTLCPYEEATDPPDGLRGTLTLTVGGSNPIESLINSGAQLADMEPVEGVAEDVRWNPNGGLLAWSGELGVVVSMLGFEHIDRRSAAVALAELVI